jgi:hypothetical protein
MKRSLLVLSVLAIAVVLFSCKKKEVPKLQLFSAESMAFDTGSEWEVNYSVYAKGFQQEEKNGKFTASLSYSIDLTKPDGQIIKGLVAKVEDKTEAEKLTDTRIDTQFNLDSTYKDGIYKLTCNVKDVNSGQSTSSTINVELKKY